MKLIYSQGFSRNEKLEWKPVIFNNIIQSYKIIAEAMGEHEIQFDNPDNEVSSIFPPAFIIVLRDESKLGCRVRHSND